MKAKEALLIFERAKETGFCVSLRGFASCIGVVPSTIVNWKNNPEKELKGIETIKVKYVEEEIERYEPDHIDWSSFRREAAKDAMCSIIHSDFKRIDLSIEQFIDGATQLAIQFADALIEKLKQE